VWYGVVGAVGRARGRGREVGSKEKERDFSSLVDAEGRKGEREVKRPRGHGRPPRHAGRGRAEVAGGMPRLRAVLRERCGQRVG
jgi:hypothetical protein